MTLVQFVTTYGYLAVLAGTLLEGESILLLAGFAAHQGYLSLEFVMAIAFIGGTSGDQLLFWVGRRWGDPLLHRFPAVHARTLQVGRLMRRWDAALVFSVRFLYGLRIAGPVAMGALGVGARRFAIFNALGAAVWAVVIAGLGYLLGASVEILLGDIEAYEGTLLWCAVAVVAACIVAHTAWTAMKARDARRRVKATTQS
jgi:membrane protein DedA with SNARE-associated domain